MDIRDLEKDELVDLAGMLGARLARSVELELMLGIRVKRLERDLDAQAGDREAVDRADALAEELEAANEENTGLAGCINAERATRRKAEEELRAAKKQWKEFTDRSQDDINSLKVENNKFASDIVALIDQLSQLRSDLSAKQVNEKRLERELREARATVMNEISAIIPKAVEAERKACNDIAVAKALESPYPDRANIAMDIANAILARKPA